MNRVVRKPAFAYAKTKFLHVSKISFNKRYLLHTYDLLYLYCYRLKKERTDPGAPPWTMDRVDSELAKRLRRNLTKDSHVTPHTCHKFLPYKKNCGEGGGPFVISML